VRALDLFFPRRSLNFHINSWWQLMWQLMWRLIMMWRLKWRLTNLPLSVFLIFEARGRAESKTQGARVQVSKHERVIMD
jgi:hypothetical protein